MKKFFLFIIKFIVIMAILAVAGYYSFNVLMSAFVREKAEVLVPDLQGKNLVECLDMLSQSKLALMKEGSEFNQDVPAGIVIRQVPPAGMNVKEGKVIKIVISQGGEIVYVPDLKGQTIRSATISLRSLGLVLGELTKKASVKTMPYPGFPTDMQPQFGVLLSISEGTSYITEGIWDARFQYTAELNKMGANISVEGKRAVFEGVEGLSGSQVYATDLRAGAALILAGLAAKGTTEVLGIEHVDRGYEHIEKKFQSLGADIRRVTE